MQLSGWAEAPGCVPHRRCPRWRGRLQCSFARRLPPCGWDAFGTSCSRCHAPQAQPHGGSLRANGPCKHSNNALASARTFGAKHRRGLPPSRWVQPHVSRMAAACGQRALPTRCQCPLPARAPSVRNTAGGFRPAAGSNRNVSRMAAACGQRIIRGWPLRCGPRIRKHAVCPLRERGAKPGGLGVFQPLEGSQSIN